MFMRLNAWIYAEGTCLNCYSSPLPSWNRGPYGTTSTNWRRKHIRSTKHRSDKHRKIRQVRMCPLTPVKGSWTHHSRTKGWSCVTLAPLAAEILGVSEDFFYIRILGSVPWGWQVESYHSRSNTLSLLLPQGPQKDQRTSPPHLEARAPAEEAHLSQAQPREAERVWTWGLGSIFSLTIRKPPAASARLLAISKCACSSRHHLCIYGLNGCVSLTSAHRWLRDKSIILQTPAFELLRLWVWVGLRSWFAIWATHWNWLP